jgi:predicted DNA-binding protein
MAKKSRRKKPGPPARYGYRPTLTIRLTEPVYERIKRAAAKLGKSLSEQIEDVLTACGDLETAHRQLEDMRANTAKMHAMAASLLTDAWETRTAARVHALRAAAIAIMREEGRPRRLMLDIDAVFAEAKEIERGIHGGKPPVADLGTLAGLWTAEEDQRALAILQESKRLIADAWAKIRAGEEAGAPELGPAATDMADEAQAAVPQDETA